MPALTITTDDLAPFADIEQDKAEAMITDAMAMAVLVAPCLFDAEFAHSAAARAVIRGAILRWNEAGQGGVSQQTALGFSQTLDTRQTRRAMFWPSEIEQLQKMCTGDTDRGIWSYDTVPAASRHTLTCALMFGAEHCSCGTMLLA